VEACTYKLDKYIRYFMNYDSTSWRISLITVTGKIQQQRI